MLPLVRPLWPAQYKAATTFANILLFTRFDNNKLLLLSAWRAGSMCPRLPDGIYSQGVVRAIPYDEFRHSYINGCRHRTRE